MVKTREATTARDRAIDERIRQAVSAALEGHVADRKREKAIEAILTALGPVVGAKATRRRHLSFMMAAFRDGFLAGRAAGRFARWHGDIWRASATYRGLTAKVAGEDEERYARYNY